MEDCNAMITLMNQKENVSKEDEMDKVEEDYFRSMVRCLIYLTKPGQISFFMLIFSLISCIMLVKCI